MVSTPISNAAFRQHAEQIIQGEGSSLVPCLGPEYTSLTPSFATPSMVGIASPWIDVASTDERIALVSRQALNMEIAYAAFCGVSNVILPSLFRRGQDVDHDTVSRYANAVASATAIGPYLQLLVPFPMDNQTSYPESPITGSLSALIGADISSESCSSDPLSPWDAWIFVRASCNYHAKLVVGMFNSI